MARILIMISSAYWQISICYHKQIFLDYDICKTKQKFTPAENLGTFGIIRFDII